MHLLRISLTAGSISKILFWSVVTAVPLASFLSFSVQPMVGKMLLPSQGGGASTWLGTMLYFQIAILLGYGLALWILRLRAQIQVVSMVGLALLAAASTRLYAIPDGEWTGLGGILATLVVTTLPAMILLFAVGPLMHGWLQRRGQVVPYFLYAISNAGSLVAVLLYPFTIERSIGIAEQSFLWQGWLWILAGLIAVAGFCFMRASGTEAKVDHAIESIPRNRVITWICLSALTCVGMLGATHHIAAEIGSAPIAWVGPFGAFLLSFLVIFSGRWHPRLTLACLTWLAVSLTGFMLTKGVSSATVAGPRLFWLLSLTAAVSFFGNGLLHDARPARRFAFFYLMVAVGGVIGGLFASLAAPLLFLRPSEFVVVSSILLTFGLIRLLGRGQVLPGLVVASVVLAPVIGLVIKQTQDETADDVTVRRFRNSYGSMMLEIRDSSVILSSETTTHGSQMTADAEARRHPTLYYTESSAVGRTIEELQKIRPSLQIGSIGLGAGTLAAYARPGDRIDFWDIDPKAMKIAHNFFTYVADCRGDVQLTLADGRKALETSSADFDLIVIDAFCGDGIPNHLLTREALAIYFERVEKHRGLIAIHASNRYSTIFPIVAATAETLGWSAINVLTAISETTPDRDWDANGRSSQYILLCRPKQLEELVAWLPAEEDEGRVERTLTVYQHQPPGRTTIWLDDRHAALEALDLSRYVRGQ